MTPQCYVYALADPRDQIVFYVGKGIRNRAGQHTNEVRNGKHPNGRLTARIQQLHDAGLCPQIVKLSTGLTDAQACRLERAILKQVGHLLTNIAPGVSSYQERLYFSAVKALKQFEAVPPSPIKWVEEMRLGLIAECQSIISKGVGCGTA